MSCVTFGLLPQVSNLPDDAKRSISNKAPSLQTEPIRNT